MHLVRYRASSGRPRVGVREGDAVRPVQVDSMAELLAQPMSRIRQLVDAARSHAPVASTDVRVLPPVDGRTEVWASGVTYRRSREARIEESSQRSVYRLVYDADRPELFFKAAAWRVVTNGEPVAIRGDSLINVPEAELAVVCNRDGEIAGYVVCNDMSSRSIEGENPLYLPQAKIYAGSCAVSDGIRPAWEVTAEDLPISLTVSRAGRAAYHGETSTAMMHRPLTQLVSHLFAAENHPDGALLSTGTGIVPDINFSLEVGDTVTVVIDGVGTLTNDVVTGPEHFGYLGRR
ncbi:fumarylacetoacetate hydrolase family protein [Streptomyces sp. NPDC059720]|uniref:fumarylacetoacetate hydrolase family protein n=1 Tax=Streptomyces sp. NPDC059720 TaxID=3346924 RepID=UPI0036774B95